MIRGQPVETRAQHSRIQPEEGRPIIKKVLESAIANAEHNDGADVDELKVTRILVEKGAGHEAFPRRAPRGAAPHR